MNRPIHRLIQALKVILDELEDAIEDRTSGHPQAGSPIMGAVILKPKEGVPKVGMISVEDTAAPLEASVVFLDAKGAPATVTALPTWSSDNEDSAAVEAADDGMSATVTIGLPGAAIISVEVENEDGSVIDSQGTVTVIGSKATTGDVQFAPTEAPVVNPE
jgi:hypothetical protein